MIDKHIEIRSGMVVRHDEGLTYRVDGVSISTVDYEQTRQLGGRVIGYTQLEEGGMPAGTKYSKDETGFRQFFTLQVSQA